MIEVSGLFKSYGPIQAIHDINFKVKRGEVVGFLGPNGAGKSTTMKIITGSMAPSGGSVRVAGFDVFEDPIEVKKRIGYLPENPPVYGDMSVESYLKFVAKLKGVEASRVKAQVEKSIEKTDLGSVRRRLIQNLSKGYRQRVGIAQALVSDPEVLILDEPTSGLDPRQVAEVRALIKELKGEHTIILSTHILPEVQAMCERIIIINRGHIVAQDSLEGLSTRMAGATQVKIKVARPSGEVEKSLQAIPGVSALVRVSMATLWRLPQVVPQTVRPTVSLSELLKQPFSRGRGFLSFAVRARILKRFS
ncbi:MAG: ATP-binding cassette domain-containing protein [Bdellovibrionales bacterium]|nr:ATP-binding cassette domain-containing protein [Bdellovibrionales bacterium]